MSAGQVEEQLIPTSFFVEELLKHADLYHILDIGTGHIENELQFHLLCKLHVGTVQSYLLVSRVNCESV